MCEVQQALEELAEKYGEEKVRRGVQEWLIAKKIEKWGGVTWQNANYAAGKRVTT